MCLVVCPMSMRACVRVFLLFFCLFVCSLFVRDQEIRTYLMSAKSHSAERARTQSNSQIEIIESDGGRKRTN